MEAAWAHPPGLTGLPQTSPSPESESDQPERGQHCTVNIKQHLGCEMSGTLYQVEITKIQDSFFRTAENMDMSPCVSCQL